MPDPKHAVLLEMPKSLHDKLVAAALAHDRSIRAEIRMAIRAWLRKQQAGDQ
ncbi:MAG TPA: hypothetical protein VM537_32480 [Anaerolineae bacterium]|nr:hypothetical protein [Anaerolineae bacterium]